MSYFTSSIKSRSAVRSPLPRATNREAGEEALSTNLCKAQILLSDLTLIDEVHK